MYFNQIDQYRRAGVECVDALHYAGFEDKDGGESGWVLEREQLIDLGFLEIVSTRPLAQLCHVCKRLHFHRYRLELTADWFENGVGTSR